ncbi:MAG: TerB family tellurite resistance protein [Pseudomonadota bacterium]
MFAEFLGRLTAPDPDPLDDGDARLALAALLVRLARSDGEYDATEISRIDAVLSKRYGLGPFEVGQLRSEAEVLEKEAPDTVRFTRAIKDAVAYEDRAKVVESLWEIVLADGTRDDEEDALMRLVAPMLGINDRESALARQRVERKR